MTLIAERMRPATGGASTMRATVFHGPADIRNQALAVTPVSGGTALPPACRTDETR
jgi:hypothetical protein